YPSAYLFVSTDPIASRTARETKFSLAISSSDSFWRPTSRTIASWISGSNVFRKSMLSASHPGALDLRDLLDAQLGDAVRGLVGRDPLRLGQLEDLGERVVDLARLALRTIARPAVQLAVDVDQPAGVDHVVRRVEDAAPVQLVSVPRLGELVVGRAGDDLELELRDRLVVDDGAQRARRKDLGVDAVDPVRADGLGAEVTDHLLDPLLVDVGHDQLGALLGQVPAEVVADV